MIRDHSAFTQKISFFQRVFAGSVRIEGFLRTCDRLRVVTVIGLLDERLGEIAAAIIITMEGEALSDRSEIGAINTLERGY